jgi:hypothetical protein
VDPRTGLDWCKKFHTPPEFDPWTLEPIANHLTDFAIPAHACSFTENKRKCTNMFLKLHLYSLHIKTMQLYHLPLNLRLLAVEVLHEDDDQFGIGGGGGGG